MTKKQKKLLIRIICAALLFGVGLLLPENSYRIIPFVCAYVSVGYSVIIKAAKNICHGRVFDENFLMLVATLGAFALREYPEAVAVMLFYQTGELFESVAVGKSRKSISELINIVPETANRKENGQLVQVMPEEVVPGDIIVVRTGEKIPLDGIVISGITTVDASALTGESTPRELNEGETALSGCINLGDTVEIRVTKEFEDSTASRIMYLVEEASSNKAKTESFITGFARWYTPAVVGAAVIIGIVPSLITGEWSTWISRALLFLVVSCPCALVISVPLTFFCSLGNASAQGILVKGSNYLELISKAETAVFDKTGTLTKGKFGIKEICPYGIDVGSFKKYISLAESFTDHPVAMALVKLYDGDLPVDKVTASGLIPGKGVYAVFEGKEILAGNEALMLEKEIAYKRTDSPFTVVYLAVDGQFAGSVILADSIKPESADSIAQMKKRGVSRVAMLTGDKKEIGEYVANETGIQEVYWGLLPEDKLERLKEIKGTSNKTLIYTGDGLNDAPVIAEADVGIAMGALGSDAAIEAADIVIMDDNPEKLVKLMDIGKKTMALVKQNIGFALSIKFAVMLLGVSGIANMWMAVFADVGVSVIAIINALRGLK